MFKFTAKYTDLNGLPREEDHFFMLTKARLAELELNEAKRIGEEVQDGLRERLQRIGTSGSGREIMDTFQWIMENSYGIKSEDGRHFRQSPEIYADFKSTEPYNQIFLRLLQDAEFAQSFLNSIVPSQQGDTPNHAQASTQPQNAQTHPSYGVPSVQNNSQPVQMHVQNQSQPVQNQVSEGYNPNLMPPVPENQTGVYFDPNQPQQ